MKKRDSFVLYTSQRDAVQALSDEDAGRLFKAIYSYQLGEGEPALAPMPNLVFLMMRPIFDRDALKWEETARKRAEAGAKGGRAKAGNASGGEQDKPEPSDATSDKYGQAEASNAKQSQAPLSNTKQTQAELGVAKQSQANQAVIGIGIVSGIGNVTDTVNTHKEACAPCPYSPEDVEEAKNGIRREAESVRQEFDQLREAYKAVRDDGPMAGWPEYQQARRSKGWPGLLFVLDRLQTLIEQDGQWKRGYREGLRRFLADRMWEMEPRKAAPDPNAEPEKTAEDRALDERIAKMRAEMKAKEAARKKAMRGW